MTPSTPASRGPHLDENRSVSRSSKFVEDLPSPSDERRRLRAFKSVIRLFQPFRKQRKLIKRQPQHSREKHYMPVLAVDGPSEQHHSLAVPTIEFGRASVDSRTSVSGGSSRSQASQRDSDNANAIAHRQSLEAYEKTLTIQGDSRRHKFSVNLDKLREVQDDDRTDSVSQHGRDLHRAAPLLGPGSKSGGNTLMEKALERHQQEKAALFRFKGKKPMAESGDDDGDGPVFTMSFGPASSPERIMSGTEDVDPLTGIQARRCKSMAPLRAVTRRVPTPMPQKLLSISQSTTRSSDSVLVAPPASWARFSSHDRRQRCGSAGALDSITTRDFAPHSTGGNPRLKKRSLRHRLPFSSGSNDSKLSRVWRYYANLISSGSAHNRRTSVTTAGSLKNPELELLPPIVSDSSHHDESVHPAVLTGHLDSSDRFSFDRISATYELSDLCRSLKDRVSQNSADLKPTATEQLTPLKVSQAGGLQLLRDPALAIDGASEVLCTPGTSPKAGAQELSNIYQRELPDSGSQIDHSEATYAASIPLPDTPSRIPTLALRRHKSPAQQLPSAPRALNSPRATIALRLKDNNVLPVSSLDTSCARVASPHRPNPGSSTVSIRRFPSVTVVDDGKGEWRSVSLISPSAPTGRTRVSTPMPGAGQVTALGQDEGLMDGGDVRASTTELLVKIKEDEERELGELRRLLTAGLLRGGSNG